MKKAIETLGGTLGDAATFPDILAGAAESNPTKKIEKIGK